MNVKIKSGRVVVCLIMAIALLMSGGVMLFAKTADVTPIVPANTYTQKQIARYSLDEVKTVAAVPADGTTPVVAAYSYYEAENTAGVAIDTLKGVTKNNSAKLIDTAIEGARASKFDTTNIVVPKFLAVDKTGFTASAWMINRFADKCDWRAFMNTEGYIVGLPNLDTLIPWKNNLFPSDAQKFNGGQWDSFMNRDEVAPPTSNKFSDYFYLTVSIDETGVTFYKNGVKLISYATADQLNLLPEGTVRHTVGEFAAEFIRAAKADGMTFFNGDIFAADDLRLYNTLTEAEVLGLYNEASSLTVSKISSKVGANLTEIKAYDYNQAITGVPYDTNLHNVNYVTGGAGAENASKPEIIFTAAKFDTAVVADVKTGKLTNYTTGVTATKLSTSEPIVDTTNKITKFYEIHQVKIGNMTREFKINFVRNDDMMAAKKFLSNLNVGGVLIKGFDMADFSYDYTLAPTVTAVPAVTYAGIVADSVTITDNKADDFNGEKFAYIITIKDKTTSDVLNTYTINFKRTTSGVVSGVNFGGTALYNFNKATYFADDKGVQNAYVDAFVTDNTKITSTLAYGDTAEIKSTTIDLATKRVTIVVTDTVSNKDYTYALDQKVFSAETDPLYSFDFNSTNLTEEVVEEKKTGSYVSADGNVKTMKTTTIGAKSVTLGEDGYIDINNAFSGAINPDGVTISTWVRMSASSKNEWAGIITLETPKTLIVNNNQVLTGDYSGTWSNEGSAANSEAFKSDVYKQATLVITKSKAVLYVDGGVKAVKDSVFFPRATTKLGLGRSFLGTETLGSGEFKNITIYNEPLSADTVVKNYQVMESAMLTSLKFSGSENNVKDFAGVNFNYELDYSSDKTAPVAADFPTLVATNGNGAVTSIVAGAVDGASLTYTITSEANGFTNTYTVKVTLVNNNYIPKKVEIKYSGAIADIDATIAATEFELVGGKMVATYKVWTGCDISKLLINYVQDVGQSKEAENFDKTNKTHSIMLYAADSSSMEYVINFVEDASVVSPDQKPNEDVKPSGCGSITIVGSIGGGIAAVIIVSALLAGVLLLRKKKATNK